MLFIPIKSKKRWLLPSEVAKNADKKNRLKLKLQIVNYYRRLKRKKLEILRNRKFKYFNLKIKKVKLSVKHKTSILYYNIKKNTYIKKANVSFRPSLKPLRLSYYRVLSNKYNSYWRTKLLSLLMHNGKRRVVSKQLYKVLNISKLEQFLIFIKLFLHKVENIRFIFGLRVISRWGQFVEYPVLTNKKYQQYKISLRNLKKSIIKNKKIVKTLPEQIIYEINDKVKDRELEMDSNNFRFRILDLFWKHGGYAPSKWFLKVAKK